MPKLKRFVYVASQKSATLHVLRNKGNLTDCGREVTEDWRVVLPAIDRRKRPVCVTCEKVD